MTDTHASLAIDAGQTGVRAQLTGQDGPAEILEFAGIRTDRPLIPQLVDVVAEVATITATRITTVSSGVSGLTAAETDPESLRKATAAYGVRAVFLAHDSITSYLGALGSGRGAVVAAGTGVVTLAVGARHVARVDGWGNLIGDAGSGYWIGRAALDAVMRDYDGRGPSTALREVVTEEFPDLELAYIELQSDPGRVRRIAAYAREVTRLAASDAVAASICEAAAAELTLAIVTGLQRVGEADASLQVVCAIGGVLRAPAIREPFIRRLRLAKPTADVREPLATSLGGAALLAGLDDGDALMETVAVSIAGRSRTEPRLEPEIVPDIT